MTTSNSPDFFASKEDLAKYLMVPVAHLEFIRDTAQIAMREADDGLYVCPKDAAAYRSRRGYVIKVNALIAAEAKKKPKQQALF